MTKHQESVTVKKMLMESFVLSAKMSSGDFQPVNVSYLIMSMHVNLFKLSFDFLACNCTTEGSNSTVCDKMSGQCSCKTHVVGRTCSNCEDEFWDFPNCKGIYTIHSSTIKSIFYLIFQSLRVSS